MGDVSPTCYTNADFTIACLAVDVEMAAGQLGVVEIDESNRIVDFQEKPSNPKSTDGDESRLCMGIYVFSQDYLAKRLREDANDDASSHDFGRDIIPHGINRGIISSAMNFIIPKMINHRTGVMLVQ